MVKKVKKKIKKKFIVFSLLILVLFLFIVFILQLKNIPANQFECVDSDGLLGLPSLNYTEKGVLIYNGEKYQDFCVDSPLYGKKVNASNYVYEYYCTTVNVVSSVIKKCNTCKDGQCVSAFVCYENKLINGTAAVINLYEQQQQTITKAGNLQWYLTFNSDQSVCTQFLINGVLLNFSTTFRCQFDTITNITITCDSGCDIGTGKCIK